MTFVAARASAGHGVIGWLKTIANRFSGRDQRSDRDRAELDGVARDLNLSPFELQRLSASPTDFRPATQTSPAPELENIRSTAQDSLPFGPSCC
jgi:hypothetical protein